jgi:tryptophan 2,3-dioxygenase
VKDAVKWRYRNEARLSHKGMIHLDEGVMEWRYRHVQMVRRTIGDKRGRSGSPGAADLATTLLRPAFPDLWAVRTEL